MKNIVSFFLLVFLFVCRSKIGDRWTKANGMVYHEVENAEWKVTYFRHLTCVENRGGHDLYVNIVDSSGKEIDPPTEYEYYINDWGNKETDPFNEIKELDFGTYTMPYRGDRPLWMQDNVTISIADTTSDFVSGIATNFEDQECKGGEKWNTRGHFSFYITFMHMTD